MKSAAVCVLAAALGFAQASEEIVPFACGTRGGGTQRCVNHGGYTCYDCGYSPCLDVNYMCWSCYGADHRCYPYVCSSGRYCGIGPCDSLEQNSTVPRATEAQIMSAIAAKQKGAMPAVNVAKEAPQIAAKVVATEVPEEQTATGLDKSATEPKAAEAHIEAELPTAKAAGNQTVPFTCGTRGGGTRRCVNYPSYTCYDCGYIPCLDVDYMCWSCYGADHRCYPYVCSTGRHCGRGPCNGLEQNSSVPRATEAQIMSAIASKQKGAVAAVKVAKEAPQISAKVAAAEVPEEQTANGLEQIATEPKVAEAQIEAEVAAAKATGNQIVPFACGTRGGGTQRCVNHGGYTCYDCGYSPCLDVNYMCWSCYGADHRCYPYVCSSGRYCGIGPCDSLEQNSTVPRATEAQIMSAIAAKQKGAMPAVKVAKEAPQIAAKVVAAGVPEEQSANGLEQTATEPKAAEAHIEVELPTAKAAGNQTVPFTCGTRGGGTRRCVNYPSYTCYDCGYIPCLDVDYMCWSCYGADHRCYPYVCSTGRHCGRGPCNGLDQNSSVPRATEAQIMSAIAAKQKGAMPAVKVAKEASQMAAEVSEVFTV